MNTFVVSLDPEEAATMLCDKHQSKMIVESLQMCGSAVIRHGATPDMMPITQKGTYLKGGYHNHPNSRHAGDTRANYQWLIRHGLALASEYTKRYGKVHFSEAGLKHLSAMDKLIPEGQLTPFPQSMPDEYRDEDVVVAYRKYYHTKTFAKWDKGTPAPDWWLGIMNEAHL